ADLEAEVGRRHREDHEDHAVHRGPPGEHVVAHAVLEDHLQDEDEHRQTGDDRTRPEEAQRAPDRPRVGIRCALRLLRAHATCSFVSTADSAVLSSRRAAWRTIFVHIHSGKAAKIHHWNAYMTFRTF